MKTCYIVENLTKVSNMEDKSEAKRLLYEMLDKHGEVAFNIVVKDVKLLNMVGPLQIAEMLCQNKINVFNCFPWLVNNYSELDAIWYSLIAKATLTEIGANLWKIDHGNLKEKTLQAYYDKVYPSNIEKIAYKIEEDNLLFDSNQHFDMFLAYWEKCGKPELSQSTLGYLTACAKAYDNTYAINKLKELSN